MAEIVESEAGPVDTFVPEAHLDDNDRRKLIAFYKEKPILWDTSLKLLKKAAKEQKETALKDLEEHFHFNYFSTHPLLSKLSIKRKICRNLTIIRWFDSSSATLLAEMRTLLLIARAMLR